MSHHGKRGRQVFLKVQFHLYCLVIAERTLCLTSKSRATQTSLSEGTAPFVWSLSGGQLVSLKKKIPGGHRQVFLKVQLHLETCVQLLLGKTVTPRKAGQVRAGLPEDTNRMVKLYQFSPGRGNTERLLGSGSLMDSLMFNAQPSVSMVSGRRSGHGRMSRSEGTVPVVELCPVIGRRHSQP